MAIAKDITLEDYLLDLKNSVDREHSSNYTLWCSNLLSFLCRFLSSLVLALQELSEIVPLLHVVYY